MKKMFAIVLTVALLLAMLLPAAALADRMMVHITAMSREAPSIGSNWVGYYQLGNYQLVDGDVFEIGVGPIELTAQITDYDSTPDMGYSTDTYNVTASRLNKGFTAEQVVEVIENGGRNKGYSALWYIYYEFTPVYDYAVLN